MRKRNLEFASDTGIFAIFGKLRRVPQDRTIKSPIGGNSLRKHDLVMLHAFFASEVMHKPISLIRETNSATVGRRRDSTPAGCPRNRFYAEMVYRQVEFSENAWRVASTDLRSKS